MEDNFEDVDIEELESRLYSQVYHTTSQDYEEVIPSVTFLNNNCQKNRYYQRYDNKTNGLQTSKEKTGMFTANITADKNSVDSSFQIVLNPINNFLVVPGPNPKETNKHRKQDSRRSRRSKERFFRKKSELQFLAAKQKSILTMQKKVNKYDKLISGLKNKKSKNNKCMNTVPKSHLPSEIINVSDSEHDDDCIMVVSLTDSDSESKLKESTKAKAGQKTISSQVCETMDDDDENNDVIFVEPPPIEVICVDTEDADDTANLTSRKDSVDNKDSSATPLPGNKPEIVAAEGKDITNESNTSNDFLESTTGLTDNFNFSLHGSDFNGDFIRPANRCEAYESASSSTSDFNPPLKAVVFNTIDFPKEDLFSEGNLDNFSQLITPKRNCSSLDSTQENATINSISKKNKITSMDASSDSSSESDYEDSPSVKHRTKKKLPDLSNMSSENEVSACTKKKNTQCLSDEDAFKNKNPKRKLEVEETPKKKSKKKKTSISVAESVSLPIDNQNTSALLETVSRDSPKLLKSNDQFDINVPDSQTASDHLKEPFTPPSKTVIKAKNKIKTKTDEALKSVPGSNLPDLESCTTQSKLLKVKTKERRKSQVEENSDPPASSVEKEANVADKSAFVIDNDPTIKFSLEHEPATDLHMNSFQTTVTKSKNKTKTKTGEALQPLACSDLIQVKASIPPSKSPKQKIKETRKNQTEGKSHSHVSVEKDTNRDNSVIVIEDNDLAVICSPEIESATDIQMNLVRKEDAELESGSKSPKRLNFSDCWSPNKKVFYSTPIDVTNCDVKTIQNTMSDEPSLWKISHDDRFPKPIQNRGPRCVRCRNFGHVSHNCPNRSIICSTCGEKGHLHNSCRLYLCKQCGESMRYRASWCQKCFLFRNKFCTICRIRGHSNTVCPDLWRRYHLTTKKGPLIQSRNKGLKPSNQLWCSACAKSGHLEASCSQSSEPQSVMIIRSYDDVYDSQEPIISPESSRQAQNSIETVNDSKQTNPMRISLPSENFSNTSPPKRRRIGDHGSSETCPFDQQNNVTAQQSNFANDTAQYSSINSHPIPSLIGTNNNNPILSLGNFPNLGTMLLNNLQTIQNALLQVPQNLSNIPLLNYQNIASRDQANGEVLPQRPLSVSNRLSSDVREDDDVYQIINFQPTHVVQEFLHSELSRLHRFSCDSAFLGRKISQLESHVRTNPDCRDDLAKLYMKFNMLVFGKHRLENGNKHIQNLQRFQNWRSDYKLSNSKRKQLWHSYNYIFGKTKHTHNPYKFLHIIEKRHQK